MSSNALLKLMVIFVVAAHATVRSAPAETTFLFNPGVYAGIASSEFGGGGQFAVNQLFDTSNASDWAIDGFVGQNPQGRDEGWISIILDRSYFISQLRFAPRKSTGDVDSIDRLDVWVNPRIAQHL